MTNDVSSHRYDGVEGEEKSHLLEEISVIEDHSLEGASSKWRLTWPFIRRRVSQTAFFLLPSFVQARLRPRSSKPEKLHPTAYLDGMRGLAALFVFFYHLSYSSHDVLTAYGAGQEGHHREFLKLPFIRFIYTGPAMVAIFYVVSGFALSYKPVRLMRNRNWPELMHTISSSIFRRAIRLYLPCFVSTLFIVFLVRVGIYELTRDIANDWHRLPNVRETHLKRFDTLGEQMADWCKKMWIFVHPWSFGTKDTEIDIDRHLWTIPMEFRSSLVLYLTQAGVARMKPVLRLSTLGALIIWCLFKDRWEMILFYAGFYFAELDFMRRAAAAGQNGILGRVMSTSAMQSKRLWNAFYLFVFLCGIYLCSQPQIGAEHSPGWAYLTSLTPKYVEHKQRFWVSWGALLLVWSTANAAFLQRIFDNGPVQYLGKISFALYLMHGPVTHTVGYASMDVLWRMIGTDTYLRKEVGFCIAAAIDIGTTVCVADVFWRAVDIPVVRFAKWFEERCIVKLD
ncbi:hypothetical protein AAFC00_006496 [Neodothiora populina]|uniref:Acyltransferase 3 domain-containing protein n=1 Tax=Neodothiora populina TaxID=2781224 RepID=A0ABR3P5D8_9PEZI